MKNKKTWIDYRKKALLLGNHQRNLYNYTRYTLVLTPTYNSSSTIIHLIITEKLQEKLNQKKLMRSKTSFKIIFNKEIEEFKEIKKIHITTSLYQEKSLNIILKEHYQLGETDKITLKNNVITLLIKEELFHE